MKANRRSFLALMGMTPITAKAQIDAEIAKTAGLFQSGGLGDATVGFAVGGVPEAGAGDYHSRMIGASDYIKLFGLPEVLDRETRDNARYVQHLDPDIACKCSWSMSVKIMTQRQRNYQRRIEQITETGRQYRGRAALKKLTGFEWPW